MILTSIIITEDFEDLVPLAVLNVSVKTID